MTIPSPAPAPRVGECTLVEACDVLGVARFVLRRLVDSHAIDGRSDRGYYFVVIASLNNFEAGRDLR